MSSSFIFQVPFENQFCNYINNKYITEIHAPHQEAIKFVQKKQHLPQSVAIMLRTAADNFRPLEPNNTACPPKTAPSWRQIARTVPDLRECSEALGLPDVATYTKNTLPAHPQHVRVQF
jgi:hypothetical protein